MRYPTISVRQPWAMMLALGIKQFETRSWETQYRGPLAIHASSRMSPDDQRWFYECPEAQEALTHYGYYHPGFLPLGAILAVGDLCAVYSTEVLWGRITRCEQAFGNFTAGRYAWQMGEMRVLTRPIPYKGHLGIWTCEIQYPKPPPKEI
jgi:activating signal cointegrator 1